MSRLDVQLLRTFTKRDFARIVHCRLLWDQDEYWFTTKSHLPSLIPLFDREVVYDREAFLNGEPFRHTSLAPDELSVYFCRGGLTLFRMPVTDVWRDGGFFNIIVKIEFIPVVAFDTGRVLGVEEFTAESAPDDWCSDNPEHHYRCAFFEAFDGMLK